MKRKMKRLPEKLSACIRLGLKDLREVEELETYYVGMGVWHEPVSGCLRDDGKCSVKCAVCFAGAVMARSLGAPINKSKAPSSYGRWNERRLDALDSLRNGHVRFALQVVADVNIYDIPPIWYVPEYKEDKEGFHRAMEGIAETLELKGF